MRGASRSALLALLLVGTTALAQEPGAPDGGDDVIDDVDPDAVELVDALRDLARRGDVDLVASPALRERVSLRRCVDLPPRQAIELLAHLAGADVERLPGGIRWVDRAPRVSLRFVEADVRHLIGVIAGLAGRNVLVAPQVRGRLTVTIEGERWLTALHDVARAAGLVVVEAAPGLLLVTDRAPPAAPDAALALEAGPFVTVEATGASLEAVVEGLTEAMGHEVYLADELLERPVTAHLTSVPWRAALLALARLVDARVLEAGGAISLEARPRITYEAAGAPAAVWFQLLARRAGLSLAASELDAVVRCELRGLPPDEVLRATAALVGARVEADGATLRLTGGASAAPPEPELERALADVARLARAGDAAALEARARELVALVRGPGAGAPLPAPPPLEPPPDLAARFDAIVADALEEQGVPEQVAEVAAARLQGLASDWGASGVAAARERVAAARPRLARRPEVLRALELQVELSDANHQLRAASEALRRDELVAVEASARAVEALAARMREDGREGFQRDAEALSLRARSLQRRGRVRARVAAIPLLVTAIVVEEDGPSEAIVNGRIVRPGELARDASGAELPGIQVARIQRGWVRFLVGEEELDRGLGEGGP